MESIQQSIFIDRHTDVVWQVLTDPLLIQKWIYDHPVEIDVDWCVGGSMIISGDLHGTAFANLGSILAFIPCAELSYSFLSSISNLPDREDSYCLLEFKLEDYKDGTILKLSFTRFPDEVIQKHLKLYWGPTLQLIRNVAEELDK